MRIIQHRVTVYLLRSLLVLGIFLCAFVGCDKKGCPSYSAQSLSDWIDLLGNPRLPLSDRHRAVLAVQAIGTNALPYLIKEIELGHALDGRRRAGVVATLEVLGNTADDILPTLINVTVTGDERSAETALWALSRMGNSGVKSMTNALAISNESRRSKVVQMLHSMGTNAHAAVPSLLICLRNIQNDYDTAFWAGCGAVRASLQPVEVLHALTNNLLEGSGACRYGSASGLRLLGVEAAPAIPALQALLSDTNERVRYAASNALLNIKLNLTRQP